MFETIQMSDVGDLYKQLRTARGCKGANGDISYRPLFRSAYVSGPYAAKQKPASDQSCNSSNAWTIMAASMCAKFLGLARGSRFLINSEFHLNFPHVISMVDPLQFSDRRTANQLALL